jgi:hypothetical protein
MCLLRGVCARRGLRVGDGPVLTPPIIALPPRARRLSSQLLRVLPPGLRCPLTNASVWRYPSEVWVLSQWERAILAKLRLASGLPMRLDHWPMFDPALAVSKRLTMPV